MPMLSQRVQGAMRDLITHLVDRYGGKLAAVYLFRVAGRGEGDDPLRADVAVFVRDLDTPASEQTALRDSIRLKPSSEPVGVNILVFTSASLQNPDAGRAPGLVRDILRHGMRMDNQAKLLNEALVEMTEDTVEQIDRIRERLAETDRLLADSRPELDRD